MTTTDVQYMFYNDPTSPLPSPHSLINSFAIGTDLVARFAVIGLNYDVTHNLAGSAIPVINARPTWSSFPAVSPSSNSITVELSVSTTGHMYAQLVGDEEQLPSSRQITEETDAFGNPASITYSQAVTAGTDFSFTIADLSPANSYTLLISAVNNDSRLVRIMRDDVMAKLEVITTAATGVVEATDDSFGAAIVVMVLWVFF